MVARGSLWRRLAHPAIALVASVVALVSCTSGATADPPRDSDVELPVGVRDELHVVIPSDDGRVLGGTLLVPWSSRDGARATGEPSAAMPARARGAPAVLLIGGSGPQDRDGTRADLPTYAPLRQLAESLVEDGFVVLRVDDRGMGESTGSFLGATTVDFAADAARAVAWLRQRRDVDSMQVTLVGHSEGALVAMLVAARDHRLRRMVLMGAPARTGRDVARWQRASLVASDPVTWPSTERASVLAAAEREAERAAARDPWLHTWFTLDPRALADTVAAASADASAAASAHSHAAPLSALLLHGETDRQVPSTQADELAAALRHGGATDVSVRRFPSTNHLFLEDAHGDPRGYGQLATHTIRADVLREIRAWLRAHSTRQ